MSTENQSSELKNMVIGRIIIALMGLGFVTLAFLADYFSLGGSFQQKGFGATQWIVLFSGIFLIIFALVFKRACWVLFVNIIILGSLLLIVDNILYFAAANMPLSISTHLSSEAKTRRLEVLGSTDGAVEYQFDKDFALFYTGRPNVDRFDEFGYRNPSGYIQQDDDIDVVIVGDSFIEGIRSSITVADYLREMLAPYRVYSLGIGGQGVPHWSLQIERYAQSDYFKSPPKVVIFNYYSENDISDTLHFDKYKQLYGKYHFSLFRELYSLFQSKVLVKGSGTKFLGIGDDRDNTSDVEDIVVEDTAEVGINEGKVFMVEDDVINAENEKYIFKYIQKAVNTVRSVDPQTQIILSYIPATVTVYRSGDGTRESNTRILEKMADDLNIHYFDGTEQIQKIAKNRILHEKTRHFNEKGTEVYSELLASQVTQFIPLGDKEAMNNNL